MESLGRLVMSLLAETKTSFDEDFPSTQRNFEITAAEGREQAATTGSHELETTGRAGEFAAARFGDEERRKILRRMNVGLRQLIRALSEDESWQAVQAKRRWEKQDMINNNPGFDPIFMKV